MKPPETYLSLSANGLLDKESRCRLSPHSLWLEGVEWLNTLGPAISLPHCSKMVPFAMSAYGDWWCWEFEKDSNESSAVILSPPDTGDCTYYAPSFDAFLFRQVLDFVSNDVFCDEPDDEEIRFTITQMQQQISIWTEQLRPYFPVSWIDTLLDLAQTDVLSTHAHSARYQYRCLLTPEHQKEIEIRLFDYPKLDNKFPFDRTGIDWYGNKQQGQA